MTTQDTRAGVEEAEELNSFERIWQIIVVFAAVTAAGFVFVSQYQYKLVEYSDSQRPFRSQYEPDVVFDLWLPVIGRSVVVVAALVLAICIIAGLVALSLRYVRQGPLWVFEWVAEILVVLLAAGLVLHHYTSVFHFLL
jgi:hypothetical protein